MLKSDAIIVGAGIAGLSAAHYLRKAGREAVVLEKSPRAGGVLRTETKNGYILELGPNTVQPKQDLRELIEDLGLSDHVLLADARTTRYVLFERRLHPVPMSPFQLATTRLLSLRGRMRLLQEPFIPPREESTEMSTDEDLLSFSRRRMGREVAERLVAPFVAGVWAGDAGRLSARSTIPQLVEWETNHGSIFKGMVRERKKTDRSGPKKLKGLLSFKMGMETLSQALTVSLGNRIHFQCQVESIKDYAGLWQVRTPAGEFEAPRLILALPTSSAAALIRPLSAGAAEALNSIPTFPLAVLHFGFKKGHIANSLKGFGYLVAPAEKSSILGCLWSSSLFPGRAPADHALLTIFMGGARMSEIMTKSDEQLAALALEDVSKTLGISGAPSFSLVTRHEKAIPQYTIGHAARIQALKAAERSLVGLKFTGNCLSGIAVGNVIRQAKQTAQELF